MEKEIKTFKDLREFLKSIPNIDDGGCGIAALIMHRWLKKIGKNSDIVYFYTIPTSLHSFKINKKALSGIPDYIPVSCSHAAVSFYGRLYDVDGVFSDHRDRHIIPELFAVQSINNLDCWNKDFDRELLPYIEEMTGVNLKDIKLK